MPENTGRTTRKPNQIDFWRGFALVTIFINHVPGIFYERFTHRNVSISDSAELFVFLAGWGVATIVTRLPPPVTTFRLVLRLGARGIVIYAAQILITVLALAMIASAAYFLDQQPILEWHNAAAVFEEPVQAHIGLVLLSHQLGYFNILPLYVVLMLGAPFMVLIWRIAEWALLPLALLLYAVTLTLGLNVPTWPVEGVWFLDPFAWQLIFVLGFLAGAPNGIGAWAARRRKWLIYPAGALVLVGAYMTFLEVPIDPFSVPRPTLFFVIDKTFLSPLRLMHFLALTILFAGVFDHIYRFMRPAARYCCMLGRNGLNVFCVGSLLSLAGQIARFVLGGSIWTDTAILVTGLVAMGATAWVSEWRSRLQHDTGSQASSSALR